MEQPDNRSGREEQKTRRRAHSVSLGRSASSAHRRSTSPGSIVMGGNQFEFLHIPGSSLTSDVFGGGGAYPGACRQELI